MKNIYKMFGSFKSFFSGIGAFFDNMMNAREEWLRRPFDLSVPSNYTDIGDALDRPIC
jgi:hypothetical protein